MKTKNTNIFVILALLGVNLIYGANYSIAKVVVPEYVGAFGFIVFRVGVSAVVFWVIYLFNFEKINFHRDGLRFVLCAVTGVAVNQLLFFKGLSLTSAVNGSIIMTLTPVLVLIWQAILIKKPIKMIKIVGVLIGMVGALIIIYNPSASFGSNWAGDLMVLANGASYAGYVVLVKPLMEKYRPTTVVTWIFSLGILMVIPVGGAEAMSVDLASFSSKIWWSASYCIVAATIIVYLMNGWAISKANPAVVGAFIYLQPVFATLTAVVFFSEKFLFKHFVAAIFVFVGVWLVTKKREP